jgi:hypothetical protein
MESYSKCRYKVCFHYGTWIQHNGKLFHNVGRWDVMRPSTWQRTPTRREMQCRYSRFSPFTSFFFATIFFNNKSTVQAAIWSWVLRLRGTYLSGIYGNENIHFIRQTSDICVTGNAIDVEKAIVYELIYSDLSLTCFLRCQTLLFCLLVCLFIYLFAVNSGVTPQR